MLVFKKINLNLKKIGPVLFQKENSLLILLLCLWHNPQLNGQK